MGVVPLNHKPKNKMHIITPNNRTNPFNPINATTPVAPQQVQSVVNPPAREFAPRWWVWDVNEVMQHIGIVGDYTKENIDHNTVIL